MRRRLENLVRAGRANSRLENLRYRRVGRHRQAGRQYRRYRRCRRGACRLGQAVNCSKRRLSRRWEALQVQRKELLKVGQQVDRFYKEVGGALEPVKDVATTSPLKKAREKLASQVAAVKAELEREVAELQVRKPAIQQVRKPALREEERLKRVAALYRKQAAMMQSFVGRKGNRRQRRRSWSGWARDGGDADAGGGFEVESAGGGARGAGHRRAAGAVGAGFPAADELRKELDAARRRGDAEEAKRLAEEKRQLEQRIRSQNKFLTAGQKSDEAKAKTQTKEQEKREQVRVVAEGDATRRRTTHAAAQAEFDDFVQQRGRASRGM